MRPVFLLLPFLLQLASAQTSESPDSALVPILRDLKGTPLSLKQAADLALNNATPIRRAEAVYQAAEGTVRRERGFFDPQLFFTLNHQDLEQPTSSFFAGAAVLATQQTASRAGLRVNLPIGTELELGVNSVKLRTNSGFAFLNPEYDVSGILTIRQPLLGGFAASARKQLTSSELVSEAEKARYDQQVLATTAALEHLYWDLYAAVRDFAVQQLTRNRADQFLRETRVRARAGLVGPNQVASARTFLAQQEILLLEREEQMDRQSDLLASLIGQRPGPEGARFLPQDDPPAGISAEPVQVLVDRALQNNLDLRASRQEVEATQALASAAGWEALPSVNLLGSLSGSGLAGAARDVVFNGQVLRTDRSGTFGNALSQTTRRDYPGWSLGLEVNIPIGLRSGLGERDRLEAQARAGEQGYLERARALEEQVRSAYREVAHGNDRLSAAREGVDAAREQVRIGLIEFHNGRTTAFELTRLTEDFAVAQQRYSAALVRAAKAASTLKQLTSGGSSAVNSH